MGHEMDTALYLSRARGASLTYFRIADVGDDSRMRSFLKRMKGKFCTG